MCIVGPGAAGLVRGGVEVIWSANGSVSPNEGVAVAAFAPSPPIITVGVGH